ncbi:hypothetical protein C8J30_101391 [Rhodobacter viridis]|uniref:Uncharacterized protein n=2 Tax=Rhodobacter viridis TaxID=1054202 RepID=A0A318U610_9RHOB|nr:DUF6477 family protein [Rhodobacter viridis]PYF13006.1 hypothetical protein C8J30_101391 [Rhodobacter viridis]
MCEEIDQMAQLRRPKLLIRAARFGQKDYERGRDLKRLLAARDLPRPEEALRALLAEEDALETARRDGAAGYSFLRHIEVLIAMMAEARLLPRLQAAPTVRVA